jgi:hypothetical protein
MIYIDFQGGAHGNYMEFVCNKFLGKVPTKGEPFNSLGASHNKQYLDKKKFKAWHYFEFRGTKTILKNSKIISIQIIPDDLLLLSSISLLRAGDYNIDNDQLEVDTYNKLNNIDYCRVLDNLISSFFQSQISNSYKKVKDSSWPPVTSLEDFKNLPQWIQDECTNVHNLKLLELTPDMPDCPRSILREFFKIGFKHPEQAGFIIQKQKMTYDASNEVCIFPFGCFYDTEKFVYQLSKLAEWLGYDFYPDDKFYKLHNDFLQKQPYKDSKKFCDQLLEKIFNKEQFEFPKLDLMQESYLTAQLELHYNTELPNNNIWFNNSQEIFISIKQ